MSLNQEGIFKVGYLGKNIFLALFKANALYNNRNIPIITFVVLSAWRKTLYSFCNKNILTF